MSGSKVSTFRDRFIELVDSSPKSRTTIANEFGVAKQTISAWTTGQTSPRLPVVSALAEYFDVNVGWLLGYDVPKVQDKQMLIEYDKAVLDSFDSTAKVGFVFPEELSLIEAYRSLTPRGQELLLERAEELKLLYGKKSESDAAESV